MNPDACRSQPHGVGLWRSMAAGALCVVLAGTACRPDPVAEIHITFEPQIQLLDHALASRTGSATLILRPGLHVVRFEKGGEVLGAVIEVLEPGLFELSVRSEEMGPIIPAIEQDSLLAL